MLTFGKYADHVGEPKCGELERPLVAAAQNVEGSVAVEDRLCAAVPYISPQHLKSTRH